MIRRSLAVASMLLLGSAVQPSNATGQAPVTLSLQGAPLLEAAAMAAPAGPQPEVVPSWTSGRTEVRDARFFGHSGALRAVVLRPADAIPGGLLQVAGGGAGGPLRWEPLSPRAGAGGLLGEPLVAAAATSLLGEALELEGVRAPREAGIWRIRAGEGEPSGTSPLAVITPVPFEHKSGGSINGYRIGHYLTEGSGRSDQYAPPAGFIEVTRENQHFHVSENFQLRQFLTKNQADIWPKYVALDLRLIDKLELVLQELNAMGIRADRMHVMSGFRTPEYNGPGRGGRAALSRHTYGDAADVWVDNDGNGYMDDLNGDGVVDIRDAQLMLRAVERVEQRFPELVGGAGVYVATSAHGPFIHIDVRGTRSRW
jgi:uncharacterized protein YcbK (DUF882 family)